MEFVNKDDLELIDRLCDRVATQSRWKSRDIAAALCRIISYITNDGDDSGGR